jgi:uncharacterized membrane protein
MLDRVLTYSIFAVAIGSGLIGGVFFAFSTFIMRALARQPAPAGLTAMQAVNVTVINPLFLGVFLGTAALSGFAIVGALLRWDRAGSAWMLAGALLYLVGTFGVTMFGNVPLNDALAKMTADDPDLAGKWNSYVTTWTMWNHVRTIAATAAMAAMIVALRT